MTKEVVLSKGQVALVDDADYEWVNQWKWHVIPVQSSRLDDYYAVRNSRTGPTRRNIYLHREIMNAPEGVRVDHVNGNGLDCRRENMRLATNAENQHNGRRPSHNTSGYKGVTWHRGHEKWRAYIQVGGKQIHLGYFDDPEVASRAYNNAAIKHFGEFARTNTGEA